MWVIIHAVALLLELAPPLQTPPALCCMAVTAAPLRNQEQQADKSQLHAEELATACLEWTTEGECFHKLEQTARKTPSKRTVHGR